MGDYITLSESLLVTVVSMLSVFVVLILISFLITGLKGLGSEKKEVKKQDKIDKEPILEIEKQEIPKDDGGISEELAAVISSAVACSLGLNLPDIRIKTIKRVSENKSSW